MNPSGIDADGRTGAGDHLIGEGTGIPERARERDHSAEVFDTLQTGAPDHDVRRAVTQYEWTVFVTDGAAIEKQLDGMRRSVQLEIDHAVRERRTRLRGLRQRGPRWIAARESAKTQAKSR